jgi:hypothetical protein
MAELTIEGLDAVQRLLAGLSGPGLDRTLQKAALGIAREAKVKLTTPPGPSNSPVIWASDAQRRAYFAKRGEKHLDPKYARISDPWSEKLEQSWVAVPWGDSGAIVGTKVPYAPYVMSKDNQQPQHKATGWTTEADVVDDLKSRNVVERIAVAELDDYIKGLKP